jgi:hypothetical protein
MSNEKQQTAVEWFYKELKNLIRESELTDMTPSKFTNKENQLIEQAKEMEKEQIVKGITFFKDRPYEEITAEQYIKETYGGNK